MSSFNKDVLKVTPLKVLWVLDVNLLHFSRAQISNAKCLNKINTIVKTESASINMSHIKFIKVKMNGHSTVNIYMY